MQYSRAGKSVYKFLFSKNFCGIWNSVSCCNPKPDIESAYGLLAIIIITRNTYYYVMLNRLPSNIHIIYNVYNYEIHSTDKHTMNMSSIAFSTNFYGFSVKFMGCWLIKAKFFFSFRFCKLVTTYLNGHETYRISS